MSDALLLAKTSNYILPSRAEKYADLNHESKNRLTQVGREQGIRRPMGIWSRWNTPSDLVIQHWLAAVSFLRRGAA